MEESRKKTFMVGAIVICLTLAGLITFTKFSGDSGGIESIQEDELIWVKCNNQACLTEYQLGLKDYLKTTKERYNPKTPFVTPLLTCKECSKDSVYRAEKCGNPDCGVVFHKNSISGELSDRCPECGYSEMEQIRKRNLGSE